VPRTVIVGTDLVPRGQRRRRGAAFTAGAPVTRNSYKTVTSMRPPAPRMARLTLWAALAALLVAACAPPLAVVGAGMGSPRRTYRGLAAPLPPCGARPGAAGRCGLTGSSRGARLTHPSAPAARPGP
jgi:hypothetical protein